MSIQTFPTIPPSYTLTKTPTFKTNIISYGNKVEQRIAMNEYPQYQFKIRFENLEIGSADQIMAFFEARKGSYEAFYFLNAEEIYRDNVWTRVTTYTLGQIIRPVTANGHSYKCTTAGTSGTSAPTFPTTLNGTVSDSGVVWTENTYLVRFHDDALNSEYFQYNLYNLNEITLIEVSA
jgi:hypothetical protein